MSINPKKNKKSLLSRSQSAWLWWRRFEEASGGCRFLLHVFLVRSPTSHSHSPHSLFPRPAASSSAVCLITDPMSFGANCSYNEYEWFSWDYSERSLTSTVVNLLCLHNSDHDRESKREGEEEEKGVPDSFTYKQTDLMHLQVLKSSLHPLSGSWWQIFLKSRLNVTLHAFFLLVKPRRLRYPQCSSVT